MKKMLGVGLTALVMSCGPTTKLHIEQTHNESPRDQYDRETLLAACRLVEEQFAGKIITYSLMKDKCKEANMKRICYSELEEAKLLAQHYNFLDCEDGRIAFDIEL